MKATELKDKSVEELNAELLNLLRTVQLAHAAFNWSA